MSISKKYNYKLGDVVEINVYEGIQLVGTITKLENLDVPDKWVIEVTSLEDGHVYEPWNRDCVYVLTKLDKVLL